MDSFPTGSAHSWLMAMVAFSPVMILFVVDAVGRLFSQASRREEVSTDSKNPASFLR
jgi:hypothetical protein